jgi:hypothetical protein
LLTLALILAAPLLLAALLAALLLLTALLLAALLPGIAAALLVLIAHLKHPSPLIPVLARFRGAYSEMA